MSVNPELLSMSREDLADLLEVGAESSRRAEMVKVSLNLDGIKETLSGYADSAGDGLEGLKDTASVYGGKYLDNLMNMDPATLAATGAVGGGTYGLAREAMSGKKRKNYMNALAPAALLGATAGGAGMFANAMKNMPEKDPATIKAQADAQVDGTAPGKLDPVAIAGGGGAPSSGKQYLNRYEHENPPEAFLNNMIYGPEQTIHEDGTATADGLRVGKGTAIGAGLGAANMAAPSIRGTASYAYDRGMPHRRGALGHQHADLLQKNDMSNQDTADLKVRSEGLQRDTGIRVPGTQRRVMGSAAVSPDSPSYKRRMSRPLLRKHMPGMPSGSRTRASLAAPLFGFGIDNLGSTLGNAYESWKEGD